MFQKISFAYEFIPTRVVFFGKFISHGSVATQLKCGGIFNNHLIASCPQNVSVNCENRLITGEDMGSGKFTWDYIHYSVVSFNVNLDVRLIVQCIYAYSVNVSIPCQSN